jgi:hypothetical protein
MFYEVINWYSKLTNVSFCICFIVVQAIKGTSIPVSLITTKNRMSLLIQQIKKKSFRKLQIKFFKSDSKRKETVLLI